MLSTQQPHWGSLLGNGAGRYLRRQEMDAVKKWQDRVICASKLSPEKL